MCRGRNWVLTHSIVRRVIVKSNATHTACHKLSGKFRGEHDVWNLKIRNKHRPDFRAAMLIFSATLNS
jgi:hypothetical protein